MFMLLLQNSENAKRMPAGLARLLSYDRHEKEKEKRTFGITNLDTYLAPRESDGLLLRLAK
jgi:hypothetical protein